MVQPLREGVEHQGGLSFLPVQVRQVLFRACHNSLRSFITSAVAGL